MTTKNAIPSIDELSTVEYWEKIPNDRKTFELTAMVTTLGWSLDDLAKYLAVDSGELTKIMTLEQVNEAFVNTALARLSPRVQERLDEHRRRIKRRQAAKVKEQNRIRAMQIKQVRDQAKKQKIDLISLLGVNERTFENWTQGKAQPKGLDAKAIDTLIADFDTGITVLKFIDKNYPKHHIEA